MTVIGRCRGEAELLSFLFAANPTRDRMTPLLGSTSQHHLERAVLTKLLASVNDDCKVDAAAWGPLAVLPRLQVREGLYVLQDSARRETMRALLKECDLYGLPPFLRSIRNPNREEESAHHELQDKSSSYLNDHRSHFFLSVDALDSAHFLVGQAEPLILQTVGEELIELSGKHMAYGLLIGEPDQIVGLLKQHNEWTAAKTARQWKEEHAEEVVKVEIAEEEEGAASGPAERRKPNPLLPHVRRTLLAAQKQQTEQLELEMQGNPSSEATSNASDKLFTQVHWITPNRLVDRPAYSYYGLIYAVVIESDVQLHDAGKLPELSVDADQVATEHNDRDVSFYVSTVVELKRN
ncbi:hypothetical protein ADEAN_000602600 [Angomonas deanei]|uniref:Uncharacterized protein n=1 Tax=Angomonas deanei TaxID=59799 RepID=A0A7G2CHJ9_9TRYP|nr:hypothetical protein ADEAN_000602600 [Angomonas deanei]